MCGVLLMSIITIILFFIYLWGFGFTATSIFRSFAKEDNFWERNFMRLGIGLAVFFIVATIFNLLRIPLDWKFFLLASLIVPAHYSAKSVLKGNFNPGEELKKIKFTKSELYLLIVLILFALTFYMYHTGAFAYQYLEDDDPWEHARAVKYIATEKTAFEPYPGQDLFRYLDPYPPAYDILVAVLYQTNNSVNWTLKFFNALIISLSIIVFYFFAVRFMKSRKKAIFATIILTAIPSYLSHFIWVHSLLPIMLMGAFYCLENISGDDLRNRKNWMFLSALAIGGIFLVHPEHAIKFGLFFIIYGIARGIFEKKFPSQQVYAVVIGTLISLTWWTSKAVSMFQERAGRIADPTQIAQQTGIFSKLFSFAKNYFTPDLGSATRAYTFNDFFIAKDANMINNPIGWGIVITLLTIISIIILFALAKKYYANKSHHPFVILGWFIISFLIVNSATFNIPGLFGFRTWLLLALPVSLICGEGISVLTNLIPAQIKWGKIAFIILILIGLWSTAGSQKYAVNTAGWPPGAGWTSMEEVQLYLWMGSNLPKETKIMSFSGSQNNEVIGLDMDNCDWCPEYLEFRKNFINKTPDGTYLFLKQQGYQYFILDAKSILVYEPELGADAQNIIFGKFQKYLGAKDKFAIAYQNKGGVVLRVV